MKRFPLLKSEYSAPVWGVGHIIQESSAVPEYAKYREFASPQTVRISHEWLSEASSAVWYKSLQQRF